MNELMNVSDKDFTMTSLDFLNKIINPARIAAGENPHVNSKFLKKVEDELDLDPREGKKFFPEKINGLREGSVQLYYDLTFDQMMLVGMRESKVVRKKVLEKLKELQQQAAKPALPDFTDPVAAARAWADEVEQKLLAQKEAERLALENKQALDYVDRQARYIDNLENQLRDGLTLPEFAKRLNGVNVQRVSEWAVAKGWVRRHGKLLVTSSQGRSGGYVYDKDGTYINPKTGEEMYTSKVQLTNTGARKMYREYLKLHLPMKKSWNGEFSNSPFKD